MLLPRHVVLAASATAGAALIVYILYKRRKANTSNVNTGFEDKTIYQPVTDVKEYRIYIVTSVKEHESEVDEFVEAVRKLKVVGLDCEWVTRDGSRRPVALLQLSSPLAKICLLLRMDQLSGQLPEGIADVLQDRSILKLGVGVVADGQKLNKDYHIVTKGCLDLRHLALRHLTRRLRGRPLSLQELSSIILDYEMMKDEVIRCGNWEANPLTKKQIDYAASDSVIGVSIFLRMAAMKLKLSTLDDFLNREETWKSVASLCQGLLDKEFSSSDSPSSATSGRKSSKKPKGQHQEGDHKPLSRAYRSRQSIMYHNCRLLSPDDTLLCTCELRKAKWYIQRGIGEVVSEDPLTVRLLFEPAGIPGPDREYYLQDKENRCVVCGREDSYIRKNVVPHEYRRHFPDYLKNHSSHDVILLCLWCHQKSCDYDNDLRQDLVSRYNAPISNRLNAKRIEDPVRVKVRSCARALMRSKKSQNIPEHRLQELMSLLEDFYGVDYVDDALLQQAIELDTKVDNVDYAGSHGRTVVEAISLETDGFQKFERLWRTSFLDKMEPKFLPALWSVDHRHEAAVYKQ